MKGPKHKLFGFLGLVSKSPTRTGLICVNNPEPNISCLGPFNLAMSQTLTSRRRAGDKGVNEYPIAV
jgi:hypothetical protein